MTGKECCAQRTFLSEQIILHTTTKLLTGNNHTTVWPAEEHNKYLPGADKSLARPGRKQVRKHVRDARDFNNIETRTVIKFFFPLQGKAPKEIYAILTKTLACFLPGWAKDLSATLYIQRFHETKFPVAVSYHKHHCSYTIVFSFLFHECKTKWWVVTMWKHITCTIFFLE